MMTMELVTVRPTDLWSAYTGLDQYPPEDPYELLLFDQALMYDTNLSNAPPMFRDAHEMPVKARDWAEADSPGNLLLFGPVGVGKTFSAVAAGALCAGLRTRGFWMLGCQDFLRKAKNYDDKETMELIRSEARRSDVLLLDDIGRSKITEADVEILTELIEERMMNYRPTIMTTNKSPEEFEEAFGDHLASRMLGGATLVPYIGPDRRVS